jgi:hypothetical protein
MHNIDQQPYSGAEHTHNHQVKSPFRAQLGEFMLESDFSYLHSILPPLSMGEMGMEGYADGTTAFEAGNAGLEFGS